MAEAPRSRRTRILRLAVTVVIVGVVAVLFGRTLIDNWAEVSRARLVPDAGWAVALVTFAAAVPVSGLLWGGIVARMAVDRPPGRREAIAVHVTSWLLKYIPGQVGSVLNKVHWGSRRGYARSLILISFLYENVFLQVASIVPSVVIIAVALGGEVFAENPGTLALPVLLAAPLLLVLVPPVLLRVLDVVSRRILKAPVPREYVLSSGRSAGFALGFVAPRIINAVGFVVLCASIVPLEATDWLLYGAAYTLAGAIGILAVFVPSGIGVREGVLFAVLVAGGATPTDAVIVALAARLVSTLADALLGLAWAGSRFIPLKGPER